MLHLQYQFDKTVIRNRVFAVLHLHLITFNSNEL